MQRALLRTAQEIAKGMDYIHSFGIIHGDLKLGNVLLKTHRVDRRGYVAKVSDFGKCSLLLVCLQLADLCFVVLLLFLPKLCLTLLAMPKAVSRADFVAGIAV